MYCLWRVSRGERVLRRAWEQGGKGREGAGGGGDRQNSKSSCAGRGRKGEGRREWVERRREENEREERVERERSEMREEWRQGRADRGEGEEASKSQYYFFLCEEKNIFVHLGGATRGCERFSVTV